MPRQPLLRARWQWCLGAAAAILTLAAGTACAKWHRYDNCRLIHHSFNDGDSFHVQCGRRHFIFRLYFVDAPETDLSFPTRVDAQAAYWGISAPQAVQQGRAAKRFTCAYLAQPFTVYTQRDDARGRSKRPRYFAMIKTDKGFLSTALVRNGLARIYGKSTTLPDGTPASRHWRRLHRTEKAAKKAKAGAWARRFR